MVTATTYIYTDRHTLYLHYALPIEAQHVHDAYNRQRRSEKIRPLIRHCTHQQTAVRPPFDGKLILASYALSLQIFGSCDKIVKDILLVQHPARIMPRRAIFARSEEHTSELQSLMRNTFAVFFY